MILIELQEVHKQFNNREIVKGINLKIKKGEILALIGTNGAGKSTVLSLLLGIIPQSSGVISRWREDYNKYVGVQLQATPFFEGHSTEDNLKLFSALYKVKLTSEQLEKKLREANLWEARKTLASRLSGGQQKRLALIVTTLHSPELIVLDEPAAGLDPRARHEIRKQIKQLAHEGTTILFTSHDMEEVARIADRVVLMDNGMIIAAGTPKSLLEEHNVASLESLYLERTTKNELWEEE